MGLCLTAFGMIPEGGKVSKACCAILLSEKALDFCGISPSNLGGSRKK
jgi:hypothetical protein